MTINYQRPCPRVHNEAATYVVVVRVLCSLARVGLAEALVERAPVADIVRARRSVGELVKDGATADVAGCDGGAAAEARSRDLTVEERAEAVWYGNISRVRLWM